MSLVDEQSLFLKDICLLINHANGLGFIVTGGELFRTPEQQKLYVQTGRSQTMNSYHLKRCAVDLNFFKDGQLCYDKTLLQPVGDYWESLNGKNRWGGNWLSFRDIPHFERRV